MKPITFNTDMVKAILARRKTQTRRPIKPQPDSRHCRIDFEGGILKESSRINGCWHVGRTWQPKYQPGKILGVIKETIFTRAVRKLFPSLWDLIWKFYVDEWIKVTGVRVERVQDISDKDIAAEGIEVPICPSCGYTEYDCRVQMDHNLCPMPEPLSPRPEFMDLWNSLYPGSWERNDWVWNIEFERYNNCKERK
jgi:hypothetical protein